MVGTGWRVPNSPRPAVVGVRELDGKKSPGEKGITLATKKNTVN